VEMALSRRGELIQAANVAQVTALEIDAQAASCFPATRTFASVVDIHARPVPQGFHDGFYRPEAVGLEMPVNLGGKRKDRMERAGDFNARAQAVVEKTQKLITLEAESAFFKWQEAAGKITKAKAAAAKAKTFETEIRNAFTGGQKAVVKDVLDAIVIVARA